MSTLIFSFENTLASVCHCSPPAPARMTISSDRDAVHVQRWGTINFWRCTVFGHVSKGLGMVTSFPHNVFFFLVWAALEAKAIWKAVCLCAGISFVDCLTGIAHECWFSRVALTPHTKTTLEQLLHHLLQSIAVQPPLMNRSSQIPPNTEEGIFLYLHCLSLLLLLVINILVHELRWIMLILQITKAEELCI